MQSFDPSIRFDSMRLTCQHCQQHFDAESALGVCPHCGHAASDALLSQTRDSELVDPAAARDAERFPIRLNCPHCRHAVVIVDSGESDGVHCPSCGDSFYVDSDRTQTWSPDDLPRLGKFQLRRAVGRGAFGTVYLAYDTELSREVAVKLPRSSTLPTAADEERFLREAQHAAQLDHRGIVRVIDAQRTRGMPYIVTEFIHGVTLADRLTSNAFEPREAAELMATVADAVHHAHQQRVIHRDLKPSNIMIDLDGQPRVMDFGMAKHDSGEITMTLDGSVLGTPHYMSPEQAGGESRRADSRSDVYSLGVILFELLLGERPFRGNSAMLLHQVVHVEAPRLRTLNHKIPKDLETIVAKCMEKNPASRYRSAAGFAEDLRRYLSHQPIHARPIGWSERTVRWCRRNPRLLRAAATVTATLVVSLLFVSWSWRNERASRLEADKSRAAALQRYQEANRAVDTWLTEYSQLFENWPGGESARRELLQEAARDYERFAEQVSNDPALELERGRAWYRLGDVRSQLGELQEGLAAFERAAQVFGSVTQAEELEIECRVELANAEIRQALLLMRMDEVDKSAALFRSAIASLRETVARTRPDPRPSAALAAGLADQARLFFEQGQIERAERGYFEAVEAFDSLQQRWPQVERYRHDSATALGMLAGMQMQRGEYQQAELNLAQALETMSALESSAAKELDYLASTAGLRTSYAECLRRVGTQDFERELYEQIEQDYARLVGFRPYSLDALENQALARYSYADWLQTEGTLPAAEEHLLYAIEALSYLTTALGTERCQSELAAARGLLGSVYRLLGRYAEARELLEVAVTVLDGLIAAASETSEYYRQQRAVLLGQLGQLALAEGKPQAAVGYLEQAGSELATLLEAEPASPAGRRAAALVHWYRGEALLQSGSEADSRAAFALGRKFWERLVAAAPTVEVRDDYARFLLLTDDRQHDRALELARAAQAASPHRVRLQATLAAACYAAGDWRQCVEIASSSGDSRDPWHTYFQAMASWQLGDRARAAEQFAAARHAYRELRPGDWLLRKIDAHAAQLLQGSSHDPQLQGGSHDEVSRGVPATSAAGSAAQ